VAPNWTTNEDLLGYLNPITDEEYHYTDFSRFLEEAEKEYKQAQEEKRTPKPYHLVLDEMNLARVEYYFAKFLSAMEVRMREGEAKIELAPDKQVSLPPNLYFIGTVNMDETTQGFAEKVYDRAQLIELEVSSEDLDEHLGEVPYREILMNIWHCVHPVAPLLSVFWMRLKPM
jgi:5-methylcytosine-specific restriction endonuclease McrBC GTP-binding regulatory subunit McrB